MCQIQKRKPLKIDLELYINYDKNFLLDKYLKFF